MHRVAITADLKQPGAHSLVGPFSYDLRVFSCYNAWRQGKITKNYNCARCTCCTRCLSHAGMNRQVAQVLQPFALQPLPEGPVAGGVLHSLKSARASAAGMD